MTRDEAKKLLPNLQAWADGKILQMWYDEEWHDVIISDIYLDNFYRIKPEPQYRPFKDTKEFEPYRDRWFRETHNKTIQALRIIDYGNYGITYLSNANRVVVLPFEEAFCAISFDDGTPFGIEVQDGTD